VLEWDVQIPTFYSTHGGAVHIGWWSATAVGPGSPQRQSSVIGVGRAIPENKWNRQTYANIRAKLSPAAPADQTLPA